MKIDYFRTLWQTHYGEARQQPHPVHQRHAHPVPQQGSAAVPRGPEEVRYEPTRVICLGDELDKHAMSFHDSDPDLPSAGDELKKALPTIKEVEKLFPVMDLIDSNHGSLLYRKAKHHGIPRHYLRNYNEVLEVGEGWKWHFDLTLTLPDDQKVYVHHGKGANALRVAQLMGMSYVAGHYHESFGVQYCSTPASLIWAMQTWLPH
jgi:hypothetical protein